jgi:hypothetical protein
MYRIIGLYGLSFLVGLTTYITKKEALENVVKWLEKSRCTFMFISLIGSDFSISGVCVYVCVCVCVRERERDRDRERERQRDRERQRERQRERDRETEREKGRVLSIYGQGTHVSLITFDYKQDSNSWSWRAARAIAACA